MSNPTMKKFVISVRCDSQIEVEAADILMAEDSAKRKIMLQDSNTMKEINRNRGWWEVEAVDEK